MRFTPLRVLVIAAMLSLTIIGNSTAAKITLVIIDANGKEQKLKNWEFVEGVQSLSWLTKPKPKVEPKEGEKPKDTPKEEGPKALIFREEKSTLFVDGILTLIPLESIRSLSYDYENKKATVNVAVSDKEEDDVVLTGSAGEYKGINTLTILAEVDKGDLGVAEVKLKGGVKGGIQGFRNETPTPVKAPEGKKSGVTFVHQGEKVTQTAHQLQPLYRVGRSSQQVVNNTLFFRKTIKVDIAKLKSLKAADKSGKEWTMTLSNGDEETFTLLDPAVLNDQQVSLQGLVGKVATGYKLFPLHSIQEMSVVENKQVD